jgi:hypothetical protein
MSTIHDRLTTRPSPRLTAPMIRHLIWFTICLSWSPFAAVPAYAVVLGKVAALEDPLNIPPVLLGLAIVISTLAGATSLAIRIDRELSAAPDMPLMRPWIMSTSHMMAAWLSGIAAFIAAQQTGGEIWTTLGSVLGASFLGAKALEMIVERWLPIRPRSPSSESL